MLVKIRVRNALSKGSPSWTSRHQLCKITLFYCKVFGTWVFMPSHGLSFTACPLHSPFPSPSLQLLKKKTWHVRVWHCHHVQGHKSYSNGGDSEQSLKEAPQKPRLRCLPLAAAVYVTGFNSQGFISKPGQNKKAYNF